MHRSSRRVSAFAATLLVFTILTPGVRAQEGARTSGGSAPMFVYVGTYTGPKSSGIYVMRFDPANGTLGRPELAAEVKNPSFLAIHPNRRTLYAVGEIGDFQGKKAGAVSAFSIDKATGKLTLLNQESAG